ncbi:MAG: HAD family hydrolase [Spirochaetota bacterium]
MSRTAILFDLDGTLTDPFEGITRCLQHALRCCGIVEPPLQSTLARYIGPPLPEAFRELLPQSDVALVERAIGYYRDRFTEVGLYENTVYPGIPEALADLFSEGACLYVATSKPVDFARRIVDHFQLHTLFRAVHGSELDGTRSGKADLIAYVLRQHGLNADTCIMVGDRMHDMAGAQACGIRAIGALWGYGSRAELEQAGATALCDRPENLASVVNALAGN